MIQKFQEWLNESTESDKLEKIKADFEKWASSLNLAHSVDEYGSGWTILAVTIPRMGRWTLEYEKAQKKGKQDSMYRQTYDKGDNFKWYIKYPARFSQYSPRANVKAGNLKSFKVIIEKFMRIGEKFSIIDEFVRMWDKDLDPSVNYSGKDLKSLIATIHITHDGEIDSWDRREGASNFSVRYSMPGGGGGTSHQRDSFDPETGALLYWALMCSVDHRSYTKEKKKEMDAELLNALEVAKDLPLEKVWADLKGGDFDAFKKKYAGSVTGKQYGV